MTTKELYDQYMITSWWPASNRLRSSTPGHDHHWQRWQNVSRLLHASLSSIRSQSSKVIAAAKAQMDKLVHCSTYVYYSPTAGLLAKRLAEITPGKFAEDIFCQQRREAIEGAMRLAKQFTGKKELNRMTQSFLDAPPVRSSVTGNYARKESSGPYLSGVAFAPAPHFYRCPFKTSTLDDARGLRGGDRGRDPLARHRWMWRHSLPSQSWRGRYPRSAGQLFQNTPRRFATSTACSSSAMKCRADSGAPARCSPSNITGVEPEIMATAKGIADGFPLGAFTARPDVGGAFKPGDHLSTFGGTRSVRRRARQHRSAARREAFPDSAARGEQIMKRLRKTAREHAMIGDVSRQKA